MKNLKEMDLDVKTPKIVVFSSSWSLWASLCTYLSSHFRQTNVSFLLFTLAWFASWRQIFHSWTPAGNDLKMIWSFLLFYSSILISAKNFFTKQNVKLSSQAFWFLRQIAMFILILLHDRRVFTRKMSK